MKKYTILALFVIFPQITLATVPGYSYNPTTTDCESVSDNAQDNTYYTCRDNFQNPNSLASIRYSNPLNPNPVNYYYTDPNKISQLSVIVIQNADSMANDGYNTHFFSLDTGYTTFYHYDEYYQGNGILHRDCTQSSEFVYSPNNATPQSAYDSMSYSINNLSSQRYTYYAPCMVGAGLATSSAYTKQQIPGGTATIAVIAGSIFPTTPVCTLNCYSNILFLPGIMGTRLYEDDNGTEKERWTSLFDSNQERLAMDSNGYSLSNLYTKPDTHGDTGITDEIVGQNIYKSFMGDLHDMTATTTVDHVYLDQNGIPVPVYVPKDPLINDHSLIPYDWRLPLDQIVSKGKVVDGKLYYGTSTSSLNDSFIVKELQRLVDTSKTGKVTIVAHSNGGLVTKELIQELKETNNPLYNKIDKVIFVAVPQVGTPDAVVGLLHGSALGDFGVSSYVSAKRARDLAVNMPMSYNLLPTESYFNSLSPLIEFGGSNPNQTNTANYGSTINTYQEHLDYLKGTEGRVTPSYDDTLSPAKANQALLNQSIITHQRLDSWLPATSTKVYQVAGWGIYTPSGIKYTDYKQCVFKSQAVNNECVLTEDKRTISDQLKLNGDGTVLSGSAQAMGEGSQTENWWVDVRKYNNATTSIFGIDTRKNVSRNHKDILEVDSLRNFIKNLVTNSSLDTKYLSRTEPSVPTDLDGKYTKYQIHSPLHLTVIDTQGNITGYSTSTGQILEQIKGSQYLESADVKTVILPQDISHKVSLTAYASGSFTFESSVLDGNTESNQTVFEAIPTSTSTIATLINTGTTVSSSTPLKLDFDGNGTTDTQVVPTTGTSTVCDVTPPELQLTFSTSTKDVILSGIDNLDQNSPLTIATSTISVKDSQSNTTTVNFKKLKDLPTKLVLNYNTISRNGVSTTTPNTRIEYDWSVNNKGILTDLDTKVIIKGIEKYVFSYKKQTNLTTIKTKNIQTNQVVTTTKTGFVPVTVTTKNTQDLLDISY